MLPNLLPVPLLPHRVFAPHSRKHDAHIRRFALTAMGVLLFGVNGCTTMGPYYPNRDKPDNSIANTEGKDYKLAFIEFGEQGSYHDKTQLAQALKLVSESKRKVLLVMYVHGWHNNAKSHDVQRFENFLGGLASSPRVQQAGFEVIGVYLGWRGESLAIPKLNSVFTIWDRKTAAERLASNNDCVDAISDLSARARQRARDQHYVVLMGHSLGGLVVERAVAHSISAAVHSRASRARPGDLIFTLNPASDSILTRQVVSSLDDRFNYRGNYTGDGRYFTRLPGVTYPGNQQAIVALSAKNDRATRGLFPIAMWLGQLTKGFHDVPSPSPLMRGKTESERSYFLSTPGNKEDLVTHDVVPVSERPIPAPRNYFNAIEANLDAPKLDDGYFVTSNSNPARSAAAGMTVEGNDPKAKVIWKRWKLTPRENAKTPYWIVQVPGEIINDHGGIWDPNAQALMAAIFRMNFPLRGKGASVPASMQIPASRSF